MQYDNLNHLDYLVEIESDKVNGFVDPENKKTLDFFNQDARFQKTQADILQILSAQDKLPQVYFIGDDLYSFWQDQKHIRGIFRKTTVKSFNSGNPQWEMVLDLDVLAEKENANWVWQGMNCLQPENDLCLLHLSNGGKDAHVSREFNLKTKSFVQNGFFIPDSKSGEVWWDHDTLLVSDATNPAELTKSGYPYIIRFWKRGTELKNAPVLFKGDATDMGAWISSYQRQGQKYFLIQQSKSFYLGKYYLIKPLEDTPDNLPEVKKIAIPNHAVLEQIYKDQFLFSTRRTFKVKNNLYKPGTLFTFNLTQISTPQFEVIYEPIATRFLESVLSTKNHLLLTLLDDVKRKVYKVVFDEKSQGPARWQIEAIQTNDPMANVGFLTLHDQSDQVYLTSTSFLEPTQYLYTDFSQNTSLKKVMQSPKRFNSEGLVVHQYKTKSSDGTLIPYFIIHKKDIVTDGKNPTLLYGYGGFEYALTPHYLGVAGKVWLEKGGVYVLSNIRGGGEYGPEWHQSVLKEKRQKVFDDFYAIAEDLIARKITSPNHLGIMGGSNGGLLTSVAFTQRPDLFNAVISEVPLANMTHYHEWLAGNSWMDEYGNPDDAKMREVLLKYSPLHNLQKDKKYPEVFYITSTKDDRVHPAHARQMVARLRELGHPVLYYENKDGGHGRSYNVKDTSLVMALEYTYLYKKLFEK